MTAEPSQVARLQRWSAIPMFLASVLWVGLAVHTGAWWWVLAAALGLTGAAASWLGARRATRSNGAPFHRKVPFTHRDMPVIDR